MSTLMGLGLGLGLAGVAGVRTYLPLMVLGILTRFSETLAYRAPFKVFASLPFLILLIAVAGYEQVIERTGDLSYRLATVGIVLRAVGGAVLFTGVFGGLGTLGGMTIGGAVAILIFLVKNRLELSYARGVNRNNDKLPPGLKETVAVAGTILAVLLPWTSYLIWAAVVVFYIRKMRIGNARYRSENRARSWR